MNFVDLCQARLNPALDALDDVALDSLLSASCNAVEHYCNRKFSVNNYDELYTGSRTRSIFLNQSPVVKITGIRYGRYQALQITNTTQNLQAATVSVTSTALELTTIVNATTTPITLSYATYQTLGELSTAINALGNGWQCTLNSQFSGWASTDLAAYIATYSARLILANINVHYYYLSDYRINNENGEIVFLGGWGSEYQGVRVQYSAGFDPVPDEVNQAVIELASSTIMAMKSDPNLQSESLGQYSYTRAATKGIESLSILSRQTLNYYRKFTVPFFKVGV